MWQSYILTSVDKKQTCNLGYKHVTLKQGQGHQTWYTSVAAKQGYNHAKFERAQQCPGNSQC